MVNTMEWKSALETLRRFCRRLGGTLYLSGVTMDEKPLSATCTIPRRLSNEEFAEALVELSKMDDVLREAIYELGEFEIEEEVPMKRYTVYSVFTGSINVHSSAEKEFNINPSLIEYVYPDSVEDYIENREVLVHVRAKGSKTAFEHGETRANAWGGIVFYKPPRELGIEKVKKYLDEFDEMLKDILKNPKNFFAFK